MQLDPLSKSTLESLRPSAQLIFADFFERANEIASQKGYTIRLIDGTRTEAAQEKRYNSGRTNEGDILTRQKQGLSAHNYGIAVDIGLFLNGSKVNHITAIVAICEQLVNEFPQLEWGGGGTDYMLMEHWQIKLNVPIPTVMTEFRKSGWAYVDGLIPAWTIRAIPIYKSIGSNTSERTDVVCIQRGNEIWVEICSWARDFGGGITEDNRLALIPNQVNTYLESERRSFAVFGWYKVVKFSSINYLLKLSYTFDEVKGEMTIAL